MMMTAAGAEDRVLVGLVLLLHRLDRLRLDSAPGRGRRRRTAGRSGRRRRCGAAVATWALPPSGPVSRPLRPNRIAAGVAASSRPPRRVPARVAVGQCWSVTIDLRETVVTAVAAARRAVARPATRPGAGVRWRSPGTRCVRRCVPETPASSATARRIRPGMVVVARLPGRPLGVKRAALHDRGRLVARVGRPVERHRQRDVRVGVPTPTCSAGCVLRYWPRPAWLGTATDRRRRAAVVERLALLQRRQQPGARGPRRATGRPGPGRTGRARRRPARPAPSSGSNTEMPCSRPGLNGVEHE